jgi:hypothetical protein
MPTSVNTYNLLSMAEVSLPVEASPSIIATTVVTPAVQVREYVLGQARRRLGWSAPGSLK